MGYLKDWDRETSILFTSMVFGSYVWVIMERVSLGLLAGVAAHFALTALYQACAHTFALPHLSYVREFERTYAPHIQRFARALPRLALRRRV